MSNKTVALVILAAGWTFAPLFAEDGAMSKSGNWGEAATWGGSVPAFGAGSQLTTLPNADSSLSLLTNDVTVGKIVTDASSLKETKVFTAASMMSGYKYADAVTPNNSVDGDWSWAGCVGRLIFDNGTSDATIEIGGTASTKASYRHVYNVPVVLKSNLKVHNAFSDAAASGNLPQQVTDVVFGRKITDNGAGKGITVTNDSKIAAVNFRVDNDFTGDVEVQRGLIRAVRPLGWGKEGTPFGHDNTVRANGGAVDLAGLKTPASQTLEIAGNFASGFSTAGALMSSCQDPDITAVWQGPVTLTADATFGGTYSGLMGWRVWTAQNFGGHLAVSGAISGAFAAHITGFNTVTFSGNNTFSGGLYLDAAVSGQINDLSYFKATSDAAFGTGGVIFNGGAYRVDADSADISRQSVSCSGTNPIRLHVSEGVTYEPSASFSGYALRKDGPGALCLSHATTLNAKGSFALTDGELILDFANGVNASSLVGKVPTVSGVAKITFRDSSDEGHASLAHELYLLNVSEESSLTFVRESDALSKLKIPEISVNALSLVNLVTPNASGLGYGGYGATVNPTGKHILSPCVIMDGASWATYKNKGMLSPFDGFVNEWGNATNFIDATSTILVTEAPAGTTCAAIRFNEQAGASQTLTLAGDLTVAEGTILMTPNTGTTKAIIAGGTVKSGSGALRIYNFNVNAPLEIASTIAGSTVFLGGPGKIVLSGDNTFGSKVVIACGELEVTTPLALGGSGSASDFGSNKSAVGRRFIVRGGPTLTFPSTMDAMKWLGSDTVTYPLFNCDGHGLTINVPTVGSTVTFAGTADAHFEVSGGGTIRKIGAGTLACSLPIASSDARPHRIEIADGGWTAPDDKSFAAMFGSNAGNYGASRATIVASNGVRLCG